MQQRPVTSLSRGSGKRVQYPKSYRYLAAEVRVVFPAPLGPHIRIWGISLSSAIGGVSKMDGLYGKIPIGNGWFGGTPISGNHRLVGFGGSFQRFHLISFCFLFDFFLISCNLCRLHFPPTLGNTRCAGRDITEQPEPTARHATKSLAEILVVVQLAISDAKQPLSNGVSSNGGTPKWMFYTGKHH